MNPIRVQLTPNKPRYHSLMFNLFTNQLSCEFMRSAERLGTILDDKLRAPLNSSLNEGLGNLIRQSNTLFDGRII